MRYLVREICIDSRGLDDPRTYRAIGRWRRMIEPARNVRDFAVGKTVGIEMEITGRSAYGVRH